MTFRITPNVKIKKDRDGITRQLNHPRQPYTAGSVADAATVQGRRQLADQYLREVLPTYNLDAEMVSDLNGAIGTSLQTSEGPRMRFEVHRSRNREASGRKFLRRLPGCFGENRVREGDP